MPLIGFFTDEDVYGATAAVLRKSGYDAVSTPETARLGESDDSQLEWASNDGRVLVTFNVSHFARLHGEWLRQGDHHAGIVVSQQRQIGDLVTRLKNLAANLRQFQNRCEGGRV